MTEPFFLSQIRHNLKGKRLDFAQTSEQILDSLSKEDLETLIRRLEKTDGNSPELDSLIQAVERKFAGMTPAATFTDDDRAKYADWKAKIEKVQGELADLDDNQLRQGGVILTGQRRKLESELEVLVRNAPAEPPPATPPEKPEIDGLALMEAYLRLKREQEGEE